MTTTEKFTDMADAVAPGTILWDHYEVEMAVEVRSADYDCHEAWAAILRDVRDDQLMVSIVEPRYYGFGWFIDDLTETETDDVSSYYGAAWLIALHEADEY